MTLRKNRVRGWWRKGCWRKRWYCGRRGWEEEGGPRLRMLWQALLTQKQPPSPGAKCLSVCGLIRVRLLMTWVRASPGNNRKHRSTWKGRGTFTKDQDALADSSSASSESWGWIARGSPLALCVITQIWISLLRGIFLGSSGEKQVPETFLSSPSWLFI